jgi:DNA-binding MarR family transcriptional regulator
VIGAHRVAGLTETQWQLLEEVAGEDFMPSMFARRRACTPAAVSRTLRRLLERGLVRVSIAESDGRQRVYRLTTRGRRTLVKLQRSRARAIEAVWERFRPAELHAFIRFASELSGRLEHYLEERDGV